MYMGEHPESEQECLEKISTFHGSIHEYEKLQLAMEDTAIAEGIATLANPDPFANPREIKQRLGDFDNLRTFDQLTLLLPSDPNERQDPNLNHMDASEYLRKKYEHHCMRLFCFRPEKPRKMCECGQNA